MLERLKKKFISEARPLTVMDAYSMTRYGISMSKDALKKKTIERIQELIKVKALEGYYSLVFDLDENFSSMNLEIVEYYEKLGFNCFILDSSVCEKIETTQLYLSWKTKNL